MRQGSEKDKVGLSRIIEPAKEKAYQYDNCFVVDLLKYGDKGKLYFGVAFRYDPNLPEYTKAYDIRKPLKEE